MTLLAKNISPANDIYWKKLFITSKVKEVGYVAASIVAMKVETEICVLKFFSTWSTNLSSWIRHY